MNTFPAPLRQRNPNTSGSSGWYQFEVTTYYTLTTYAVVVDSTNFAPGGALDGYRLTSQSTYGPLTQTKQLDVDSPQVTNVDFGFAGSGAIGDYVWYDTNGNGLTGCRRAGHRQRHHQLA